MKIFRFVDAYLVFVEEVRSTFDQCAGNLAFPCERPGEGVVHFLA